MSIGRSVTGRRPTLWARGDGPYPVQFFHLAGLFKEPVKLHVVRDEVAQEIRYSRKLFQYDDDAKFAESLPDDMGFAGFLVMNSMAQQRYWLSFLGASYFRSSGELDERGISARGIAIDTGFPTQRNSRTSPASGWRLGLSRGL